MPIFAGGRNRANLGLAEVRKDMALAGYEKTIQTAFREVADALAATDTLRREELAQRALADSSRGSDATGRGALSQWRRWLPPLLDAQRHAFANQVVAIEVSTQRQIALASLFGALGGGWRDVELQPVHASRTGTPSTP